MVSDRPMVDLPDRAVSLIYAGWLRRFMCAKTPALRRQYMVRLSKARAEMDRRRLPVECI